MEKKMMAIEKDNMDVKDFVQNGNPPF